MCTSYWTGDDWGGNNIQVNRTDSLVEPSSFIWNDIILGATDRYIDK